MLGEKLRWEEEEEGIEKERKLIRNGVAVHVVELIWILSSIHVYYFGIDRQRLIHINRQVPLNIRYGVEEMKQHTQLRDGAFGWKIGTLVQ